MEKSGCHIRVNCGPAVSRLPVSTHVLHIYTSLLLSRPGCHGPSIHQSINQSLDRSREGGKYHLKFTYTICMRAPNCHSCSKVSSCRLSSSFMGCPPQACKSKPSYLCVWHRAIHLHNNTVKISSSWREESRILCLWVRCHLIAEKSLEALQIICIYVHPWVSVLLLTRQASQRLF